MPSFSGIGRRSSSHRRPADATMAPPVAHRAGQHRRSARRTRVASRTIAVAGRRRGTHMSSPSLRLKPRALASGGQPSDKALLAYLERHVGMTPGEALFAYSPTDRRGSLGLSASRVRLHLSGSAYMPDLLVRLHRCRATHTDFAQIEQRRCLFRAVADRPHAVRRSLWTRLRACLQNPASCALWAWASCTSSPVSIICPS